MSRVSLKLITSENWREALELSVDAEQQKFVAAVSPPVAIALAKAYIRPSGMIVEPYGIYDQHNMVGFLNLHYSPDSKDDFWIFHFFIDQRFQRRGLGSEGIRELMKRIKDTYPSCQRICLTVHPDNEAALKFYTNLGFTNDNILTHGESTYSMYIG
jgi:diamine N-acetyltransferase